MGIKVLITALVLLLPVAAHAQNLPGSRTDIQMSFAPLVKKVAPAVVNIYTKKTVVRRVGHPFMNDPFLAPFFGGNLFGQRMKQQVEGALGSGVIVEADGLVITNAHVIKGADEITVVLSDGREFEAALSLSDPASDLALLRIQPDEKNLPYVSLKPSESLEVGDLVLAIGNPFGVGQTVTSGIVSAQGRSSLNINDFNFFIQTDAAINPGNSGGPLVDLSGGVVGINSAIYSRDGGSLGIGFSIPSEMVATVIAAEKSGQTNENQKGIIRPWLGVTAQTVTSDLADSLDLSRPHGALIADLHKASPLKAAGLKVGDLVTAINDRTVRDPAELKFRMATVPLGQTARFDVIRKKSPQTYEVQAIAPPNTPAPNKTLLDGQTPLNGATVANINPAISVEYGLTGKETGVIVLSTARGTAAGRIVTAGDILLEINGKTIENVSDVRKALARSRAGFSMKINSGGRTRQMVIR